MGIVTSLVVTAAVVAGSAYLKGQAAKKAGEAQKNALADQEKILQQKLDPAALNRLAQTMDRERALSRRALQEEIDPELAELRQKGKEELLKEFGTPDSSRQTTQVANQLFQENITADPRIEALKDSIINKAQSDLDAGATLPPEYQAELVRSGLSTGAGSGVGVSRNQVGGVTARLLGSAGIQLGQQRVAEAQQLTNTAQNLTNARASILSSIFPTVKATEDAKIARAAGAFQLGESTLPQSGLSGSDAVNLEVARRNAQVAAKGKKGEISANLAIAKGNEQAGYLSAIGSAASGAAGAIGGAGGVAGGAGGAPNMGVSQAAFGRQSGVGTVPVVGSDFGGANIQFDPVSGKYIDLGQPGYRSPRQQALFNQISAGYI